MMNWTSLWNRLRGVRPSHESDLDEELAFHREMRIRQLEASGLSPAEARLEATRALGNLTRVQEDAREAWTFTWLRDTGRDLAFGARILASQPGFTIAATLALILGIGVNATVFSVYNTLALAPWAIREPGQTAQIHAARGNSGGWGGVSWPQYRYLRANSHATSGIAAWTTTAGRVTLGDVAWSGMAVTTSDNFFDLLGTGFVHGRGFSPETSTTAPNPEIVLQYDTWMTRFGGDPQAVGRWIDLNGHQLQIVGVTAPGFVGPSPNRPLLWITGPWRDIFQPGLHTIDNPNSCCVSMIARLAPGMERSQAQAEIQTLSRQFLDSIKDTSEARILLTRPSQLASPSLSAKVAPIFLITGVASLLVLLLACANVANLQLARALARRREIAVRLSLGASRFRVFRQLLAESLLLSLLAGLGSLAIATWLPGWIIRNMAGPDEVLTFSFRADVRVTGFVLALTLLTSLLLGTLPAIRAVREAASSGLGDGGRTTSSGNRMRAVLLAAQVALCAILLSGAGLLVRALDQAQRMDPGFRSSDVVQLAPNLDSSGANDEQAQAALIPLIERIQNLPGVVSIAQTNTVPLGNSFDGTGIIDPRTNRPVSFGVMQVSAAFFETIGVPLVMGRNFTASDEGRNDLVIINEALARRLWPDENPLGKTIDLSRQPAVVAGVVRDFSSRELSPIPTPYLYMPSKGTRRTTLLIRYTAPAVAEALLADLPKLARTLDRRMFATALPLSRNVENARRSARVSATVAAGLSSLALLLACVGIYGVASYNVSQRTREIGVRMAMGARAGAILQMVLKQSLRTVLIGAIAGTAGAVAFGGLLRSLLYGVRPTDPLAMASAFAVLLATAILATLAPARKAASVDPAITLRHD